MDREAIATSVQYQELAEQHFSGGYFSEAVLAQGEQLKELSEEEKRAFFKDTFNEVYESALLVHIHPRFNQTPDDEIDLSSEGLGLIRVETTTCSEEEANAEGGKAYNGVLVHAQAFNPTPETRSEWINAPGDELGLYTKGPTMVTEDHEPKGWGEHIFAGLDGSSTEEYELDSEIMRLLDAKETLDIVHEVLIKEFDGIGA
jgi:hypothetical protein